MELPRIVPFAAIAVEGLVLIAAGVVAITPGASANDLMAAASFAQRQAEAMSIDQAPHSGPSSSG